MALDTGPPVVLALGWLRDTSAPEPHEGAIPEPVALVPPELAASEVPATLSSPLQHPLVETSPPVELSEPALASEDSPEPALELSEVAEPLLAASPAVEVTVDAEAESPILRPLQKTKEV